VAVAEEDVTRPTESPVTEQTSTATTIHTLLLFASSRRTRGPPAGSPVDAAADRSGGGVGGDVDGAAPLFGLPAIGCCSDIALDTGRLGSVSSGSVDSWSFTVVLLSGGL